MTGRDHSGEARDAGRYNRPMEEPQGTSFSDLTLAEFVDRLASAEPVPGGGAASAVAGALGAGLVAMVAGLSTGRSKFAPYEPTLERAASAGERLGREFLRLADNDAEAYAAFAAAIKLPKGTEAEQESRRSAMRAAARGAADVPLECVSASVDLVATAESLAGRSNGNAASDVLVAALLGLAAARGAAENVRINLPATGDEEYADRVARRLDEMLHDVEDLAARTREAVLSGQAREPEPE